MGFKNRAAAGSGSGSDIDWKGLQEYVVKECQLEREETLVGIISGLIDVGIQEQEDARVEWQGTEEQEAEEMENNPDVYFEDLVDYSTAKKEVKRYKRWPQKPIGKVAVTVDFPDIILDKAPFFGGESDPKPLRLILGGEFTPSKGVTIVSRPIELAVRKNDKTNNQWSFLPNHTFYKMAMAAQLIDKGDPFVPEDIEKLLGQALQFKVQVGINKGGYYFEKCTFLGGLTRGMKAPDFDESLLYTVFFDEENDKDALTQLRKSVITTMTMALDWNDSVVKGQLKELGKLSGSYGNSDSSGGDSDEEGAENEEKESKKASAKKAATSKKSATKKQPDPEPEVDEEGLEDDDIPF